MPITNTTPMEQVAHVRRFRLYKAVGRHFQYPGWHLWTGKRHVQLWPLWRLGRSGD